MSMQWIIKGIVRKNKSYIDKSEEEKHYPSYPRKGDDCCEQAARLVNSAP
jgi:hypothetical protein